jgi:hypothetical protein
MAVTAWRSPGTVTEDTSVGTATFTNPGNVATVGGSVTTIAWATGTHTSSRLKCTNWGFTSAHIPSGSTIDGLEFRYQRQENGTTDNLQTTEIYHIDSSGVLQTGTNSGDVGEWPTGALATVTVGGPTNKMGYNSATQSDVTDADFGISFRCGTIGSGTTPDGTIDSFELRIYYTEAGATNHALNGTVTAASAISGSVGLARPLVGTVTGVSAVSGTLTRHLPIAGTITAVSAIAGALGLVRPVEAAISAASAIVGTITRIFSIGSTVSAVSDISGDLTAEYAEAGSVDNASNVSGSLGVNRGLTGTVSNSSSISGTLSVTNSNRPPGMLGDSNLCDLPP